MLSASASTRLGSYCMLAAGVLPTTTAQAGNVISETGIDIPVNIGTPVNLDFGAGFGTIFQFSIDGDQGTGNFTSTYSPGTTVIINSQFITRYDRVKFAPGGGGWSKGSFLNYFGSDYYIGRLNNGFNIAQTATTSYDWARMNSGSAAGNLLMRFYDSTYRRSVVTFYGGSSYSQNYTSGRAGGWGGGGPFRGFMGFRFTDDGSNFYYGWVDVSVDFAGSGMTVHGWGLNTNINQNLLAGQTVPAPGGLALLALGAAGIRRSRKRVA